MNGQLAFTLGLIALIVVAGVAQYLINNRFKKEHFTVLYPSDQKLKESWDRSAVLTRVLPDGRLR